MLALGLTTFKLRPESGGGSTPAAPVITASPVLTMPTGLIGDTITVDDGTWDVTPEAVEYRLKAGEVGGGGGDLVSGATSNSFVLTALQAGFYLTYEVRAQANGVWSEWVNSNTEQASIKLAPFAISAPVVTRMGMLLLEILTPAVWGANPPSVTIVGYQWQSDYEGWHNIEGETGASYATGESEGVLFRVIVTGTNGESPDGTAISNEVS